jgi:hypothetical protein
VLIAFHKTLCMALAPQIDGEPALGQYPPNGEKHPDSPFPTGCTVSSGARYGLAQVSEALDFKLLVSSTCSVT